MGTVRSVVCRCPWILQKLICRLVAANAYVRDAIMPTRSESLRESFRTNAHFAEQLRPNQKKRALNDGRKESRRMILLQSVKWDQTESKKEILKVHLNITRGQPHWGTHTRIINYPFFIGMGKEVSRRIRKKDCIIQSRLQLEDILWLGTILDVSRPELIGWIGQVNISLSPQSLDWMCH